VTWFADPNCEAAAIAEHCVLAYAVDFDFPSGHVRLATWVGDLVIGGNTYTGLGKLGSVSAVADRASLASERWTYSVTGVDPSIIPESELDNCYGRSVAEYLAFINSTTHVVIGTETLREGSMGRSRRKDGGVPVIEISCETRNAVLNQPDGYRYTTEHQVTYFFASDLGCDFTRKIDSLDLIWGGYKVFPGIPGVIHDIIHPYGT
jgi:hypothetical protein